MGSKVYIVGAKRSPIGSFLGTLKDMHPSDFGSQVLKQLIAETNIPVDKIDEVIVGNVIDTGLGQGLARQISLKSGVPTSVPAYIVNMVCGSGMKTIMNAYTSIKAGINNLVIAGGVESMSQIPFFVSAKVREGNKMGDLSIVDSILHDALTDAFGKFHMGITAEKVAEQYHISREKQDEFAYNTQAKTIKAVDNGVFDSEIVPIEIKTRKETITFSRDEYPNRSTSIEKLGKLRAAFKADGVVTAGSSSGINDGASFTIIASEEMVKKYNLTPLAEVVGIGQGGVEPDVMGLGPTPAIRNCLLSCGMKLSEIDVLELNEAFAAQSLGVVHELSKEHRVSEEELLNKTNLNGGAIALGHPIGMSGNRIVVTLLHEMIRNNKEYGLASLCIGGGMGTAVIIKKI